ncbi:trace amine-associated receptor 1-like [Glandiceps talaboti]
MASNNTTYLDTVSSSSSSSSRFLTAHQSLILNATIGSLGVVGNFLVCFVFSRLKKQLSTFTKVFIFNQSAIDLATSVAFLIRKCSPRIVVPADFSGDLYCMFWKSGFVSWSLLMASSLNLTTLTLERYLAVIHPVMHRNRVTRKKVSIAILFIWVIPFLLELFWAFANFNSGRGGCYIQWYSVVASKLSGMLYFTEEWLLPLGVIIFSYSKISWHLVKKTRESNRNDVVQVSMVDKEGGQQSNLPITAQNTLAPPIRNLNNPTPSENQPAASVSQQNGSKKAETALERSRKNVTKTLFIVSVAYVICWTPQALWFFLYNVTETVPLYSRFHDVAVLMAYTNICINPFIYAFQYPPFRAGLKKLFSCRNGKVSDILDQSNSGLTQQTNTSVVP